MTESIPPPKPSVPEISVPEIRFQPSMLSVPSAANTVAPEQEPQTPGPRKPARRKLWFFTALAAVVGVAGGSLLASGEGTTQDVRSGSPGYRKGKSGKAQHWHKRALTIYLDDSLKKIGPGADDAVMQAFGHWAQSDGKLPDLAFDSGKTSSLPTQDGKSTISYGRISAPGHERDLAITITYSNDNSGEILEADIVLNSLYPMGVLTAKPPSPKTDGKRDDGKRDDGSGKRNDGKRDDNSVNSDGKVSAGQPTLAQSEVDDCQNRYDLQNVITHEAGHFFGLGEDPVEKGSTMFQAIDQCETHKRALSDTDVGAISTLYAETVSPEEAAAGPRACAFAAPSSRQGASAWAPSLLLLGLLAWRRRRRA